MKKILLLTLGILIKGIILGVVLAIAWPVKLLMDRIAISLYRKARELTKKKVKVSVPTNLVGQRGG